MKTPSFRSTKKFTFIALGLCLIGSACQKDDLTTAEDTLIVPQIETVDSAPFADQKIVRKAFTRRTEPAMQLPANDPTATQAMETVDPVRRPITIEDLSPTAQQHIRDIIAIKKPPTGAVQWTDELMDLESNELIGYYTATKTTLGTQVKWSVNTSQPGTSVALWMVTVETDHLYQSQSDSDIRIIFAGEQVTTESGQVNLTVLLPEASSSMQYYPELVLLKH